MHPDGQIPHPKTGELITFAWDYDTDPTEEEKADIIAQFDAQRAPKESGVLGGAVNEVIDTAKGVWDTVKEGSKFGAPGILANAGAGMAGGAWDALKRTGSAIGDAVSDPSIAGAADAMGRVMATPADLVTGGGASRLIDAGQAGMGGDREQTGRALAMVGMATLPFARPIARALPKIGIPRTIDAPWQTALDGGAAPSPAMLRFHSIEPPAPVRPFANYAGTSSIEPQVTVVNPLPRQSLQLGPATDAGLPSSVLPDTSGPIPPKLPVNYEDIMAGRQQSSRLQLPPATSEPWAYGPGPSPAGAIPLGPGSQTAIANPRFKRALDATQGMTQLQILQDALERAGRPTHP